MGERPGFGFGPSFILEDTVTGMRTVLVTDWAALEPKIARVQIRLASARCKEAQPLSEVSGFVSDIDLSIWSFLTQFWSARLPDAALEPQLTEWAGRSRLSAVIGALL